MQQAKHHHLSGSFPKYCDIVGGVHIFDNLSKKQQKQLLEAIKGFKKGHLTEAFIDLPKENFQIHFTLIDKKVILKKVNYSQSTKDHKFTSLLGKIYKEMVEEEKFENSSRNMLQGEGFDNVVIDEVNNIISKD
jgi:hypothetical protein